MRRLSMGEVHESLAIGCKCRIELCGSCNAGICHTLALDFAETRGGGS
jgi:hypothetical protein